jgi:hypothetical protein
MTKRKARKANRGPVELDVLRRHAPARVLEFFQSLDLSAIGPAFDDARERAGLLDLRDRVYRIFHTSWKMYSLGGATVELAASMFWPLGWRSTGGDDRASLVATARRWHLDGIFTDALERTMATVWSRKRNDAEAWRHDAWALVAGFVIVREVALATLEAMDRMRRGDGFLFHPREPLDSTDALFLEVWTGVGGGLRYWFFENEGLDQRCRDILARRSDG